MPSTHRGKYGMHIFAFALRLFFNVNFLNADFAPNMSIR